MPDLKVSIGGRHYNISCNPGEEDAAIESAGLFDQEADVIHKQLGQLSAEKMLLLSGLLLGDKIRTLKHEISSLEEKLHSAQSKFNDIGNKVDGFDSKPHDTSFDKKHSSSSEIKIDQVSQLENISRLLDVIIKEVQNSQSQNTDEVSSAPNETSAQGSFL